MIYRVVVKIGYNVAWFDFNTIEEAGEFAKTVLVHQTPNEDTTKKDSIRIDVIDPTIKSEEEEE